MAGRSDVREHVGGLWCPSLTASPLASARVRRYGGTITLVHTHSLKGWWVMKRLLLTALVGVFLQNDLRDL